MPDNIGFFNGDQWYYRVLDMNMTTSVKVFNEIKKIIEPHEFCYSQQPMDLKCAIKRIITTLFRKPF